MRESGGDGSTLSPGIPLAEPRPRGRRGVTQRWTRAVLSGPALLSWSFPEHPPPSPPGPQESPCPAGAALWTLPGRDREEWTVSLGLVLQSRGGGWGGPRWRGHWMQSHDYSSSPWGLGLLAAGVLCLCFRFLPFSWCGQKLQCCACRVTCWSLHSCWEESAGETETSVLFLRPQA